MSTARAGRLLEIGPPWVYVTNIDGQEFQEAINLQREAEGAIIELDCSRMLNLDQLFDAFATAAQFPNYFGRNWAAFDECLADLEWLHASSYVFALRNPQRLLEQESAEVATFWRIISKVAAEWAEEINLGEWWDREGVPFHVVLDTPPGVVLSESVNTLVVAGVEAEVLR
jgi:hypothetical protein